MNMSNNTQQEFLDYCESGDLNKVKKLLKDPNVDTSVHNNYAIRLSSDNGHLDVVRELLKDPRVDPSDMDNCAIIWSSYFGYIDVVKELLKDSRIDKHMLLNSDITDELRNEIHRYLNEVRNESISKVLDI